MNDAIDLVPIIALSHRLRRQSECFNKGFAVVVLRLALARSLRQRIALPLKRLY